MAPRLGDRLGEAKAHHALADIAERQGRYADALGHAGRALRLYRAVGYQAGEAEMLNTAGWFHALRGGFQQGRALCRQALVISAEHEHDAPLYEGAGSVWDTMGHIERHLGNVTEAVACYERSLGIFQSIGFRAGTARTLICLGEIWHETGELVSAKQAWQEALEILEDLDLPGVGEVRAKLAAL